MIILITALLCLGQHLLPEPAALLAALEADASILALSVFVFVSCRVRLRSKRLHRSHGRR